MAARKAPQRKSLQGLNVRTAHQRQFDAFRLEYNTERPRDALGGDTPASRYTGSPRPYPERPPVPEYPGHWVKRVTDAGTFRFQRRLTLVVMRLVAQVYFEP